MQIPLRIFIEKKGTQQIRKMPKNKVLRKIYN